MDGIMLPLLSAISFSKVMGSGRTQPCLMVCEDEAGAEVEVVVKLRKHPQILPSGFVAEAMASFLAQDLGLPVQQPCRVLISKEFAQTVPESELRAIIEKSEGLNFGSAKWSPGHTIWPRDQSLPKAMKRTAMEIFAFDALIQNPDRRAVNPNCVFLGDEFLLYDHESAFSNFFVLFAKPPWEPGGLDFLKDHIFYHTLRGEALELDRLHGALEALDASRFQEYVLNVPADWNGETITSDKVSEYLLNCIPHFDRIKLQIQSVL
jgi:hypothetical protein